MSIPAIQEQLLADEILVVFAIGSPRSSRWVIAREHAVFDAIDGREAIAAAAGPARLGELLLGGISTAPGRPMLVVGDRLLRDLPFESIDLGGEPLSRRHQVTWFGSIEELVGARRAAPGRHASESRILAIAATFGALAVAFRRVFGPARSR